MSNCIIQPGCSFVTIENPRHSGLGDCGATSKIAVIPAEEPESKVLMFLPFPGFLSRIVKKNLGFRVKPGMTTAGRDSDTLRVPE